MSERAIGRSRLSSGGWLRLRGTGGDELRAGGGVATQHRVFESRLAVAVGRIDVGAKLDEQREDVVTPACDREVQRCLPVIETRHAAIERSRMLLDDAPNHLQIAESDGREDVMPRPAFDEQRKNVSR